MNGDRAPQLKAVVRPHVVMKYYQDFSASGDSFEDRIGPPDEFDAAMGRIALGFSFLDDTARNLIVLFSKTDRRTGFTLAAQLSFKQKLEVLEALVANELERVSDDSLKEQVREMFTLCRRSEELRNSYLHSSYSGTVRAKFSAKDKRGLRITKEQVSPALLLDVADFIVGAGMEIEGLPLLFGYGDTHGGSADYSEYLQDGKVIARFRFGEVD